MYFIHVFTTFCLFRPSKTASRIFNFSIKNPKSPNSTFFSHFLPYFPKINVLFLAISLAVRRYFFHFWPFFSSKPQFADPFSANFSADLRNRTFFRLFSDFSDFSDFQKVAKFWKFFVHFPKICDVFFGKMPTFCIISEISEFYQIFSTFSTFFGSSSGLRRSNTPPVGTFIVKKDSYTEPFRPNFQMPNNVLLTFKGYALHLPGLGRCILRF